MKGTPRPNGAQWGPMGPNWGKWGPLGPIGQQRPHSAKVQPTGVPFTGAPYHPCELRVWGLGFSGITLFEGSELPSITYTLSPKPKPETLNPKAQIRNP